MFYHKARYTIFLSAKEMDATIEGNGLDQTDIIIGRTHWRPATDIYEDEKALHLFAEIGWTNLNDIDLTVDENSLIVNGFRRFPIELKYGFYRHAEIPQGSFRIEVILPCKVDPERIKAQFDQGILWIVLPKLHRGEDYDH